MSSDKTAPSAPAPAPAPAPTPAPAPGAATAAPKPQMCGGIGNLRPVTEDDLKIWELYKGPAEKKIQDQFHVPKTFQLKPVQVSTQTVAGQNYFFKVELPDKKYATARLYHVPWQQQTHGSEEHVAVHNKLGASPNEDVGHF